MRLLSGRSDGDDRRPLTRRPARHGRARSNIALQTLRRRPYASTLALIAAALALVTLARAVPRALGTARQHKHHTALLLASERPYDGPPTQNTSAEWSERSLLPAATWQFVPRYGHYIRPQDSNRLAVHRVSRLPHPLVVPSHAPRAEEIVFGWTTSVERVAMHAELWKPFLRFGSPCVVVLPPPDRKHLAAARRELAKQDISCRVIASDVYYYRSRVFLSIVDLHDYAVELGAKWLVMCDDDTIWPDLRMLQRLLADYDHTQDVFSPSPHCTIALTPTVAAATESQGPLKLLSEIAFGGGGMLLSVTLGGLLKPHASWCVKNLNETIAIGGGDGLLTYCTAHLRNPTVPAIQLRNESLIGTVVYHDSLHQFDVAHDAAGLFQSGQQVVSFHHAVHGWYHLYPRHHLDPLVRTDTDVTAVALMQRAATLLGGDNMFRRFVFDDGRVMVCLGYTITIYNEPLTPFDLTRIETTWPEPLPPRKDLIVRPGIPEGRPPGSDDPDFKTTYFLRSIRPLNDDQFELLHSNMRAEVIRLIWAKE